MKKSIVAFMGLMVFALLALSPTAASAADRLFSVEALSMTPPPSAAPRGCWTMIPDYGYMWLATEAAMDAEWAPWDPWWAMPYGHWCFVPGYGWAWSGGLAGGLIGMNPSLWPGSNYWYEWRDREVAEAWVNRHQHMESDAVTKVKVSVVVASPPPTMTVSTHNDPLAQLNTYRQGVRPNDKHDGQVGRHKDKGHVRTWDEIIAARKARGLYGPPVHHADSGDGRGAGASYSGPVHSSGAKLTILPSSSGSAPVQK